MAHPAEELEIVPLEAHPGAAAEAQAAAGELGAEGLDRHGEPGGEPLDDDHQGRSVRLPGGQEAQHALVCLSLRDGTTLRIPAASRRPA